jgi:hypothetical protein
VIDVISVHIPKTAGTSFRRALEHAYPPGAVLSDYQDHLDDPLHPFHTDPPAWEATAAAFVHGIAPPIRVVHGHFSAVKYHRAFPAARWITWLRHPVARLASHYYFWKTFPIAAAPHHPLLPPIQQGRMSLAEFAEVPVVRDLARQHYLRGLDLSDFAFVGLQEHYAADLAALGKLFGWRAAPVATENRNPEPGYTAAVRAVFNDPGLVRRIEALNAGDMELYEEAQALRTRRVGRRSWWLPWRSTPTSSASSSSTAPPAPCTNRPVPDGSAKTAGSKPRASAAPATSSSSGRR